MSHATSALPGGVVLGWPHGATGPAGPCVSGDGLTVCRSPVKDVPCHKGCAGARINDHAADAAGRARLIRACTPRGGGW